MIDLVKITTDLGINIEDFQMLLTEYFEQAKTLCDSLKVTAQKADVKNLLIHAHSLKGMSGNMGVESVREFATQIESAAKSDDLATCLKLIGECTKVLAEEEIEAMK